MKTSITSTYRPLLRAVYAFLIAITALSAMPRNAQAQLYVTQVGGFGPAGVVSEYDAHSAGTVINANLVTGLNGPVGLAFKGKTLFMANQSRGTVVKYDVTSGAVNANFITGLKKPTGLAVTGNTLYVSTFSDGTVGAYNADTGAVQPFFTTITGLSKPAGLAVAGNILYVANFGTKFGAGSVGAYDAEEGDAFNANFITGLNGHRTRR
jgi:outer membrane protein assembly factor BamB